MSYFRCGFSNQIMKQKAFEKKWIFDNSNSNNCN